MRNLNRIPVLVATVVCLGVGGCVSKDQRPTAVATTQLVPTQTASAFANTPIPEATSTVSLPTATVIFTGLRSFCDSNGMLITVDENNQIISRAETIECKITPTPNPQSEVGTLEDLSSKTFKPGLSCVDGKYAFTSYDAAIGRLVRALYSGSDGRPLMALEAFPGITKQRYEEMRNSGEPYGSYRFGWKAVNATSAELIKLTSALIPPLSEYEGGLYIDPATGTAIKMNPYSGESGVCQELDLNQLPTNSRS